MLLLGALSVAIIKVKIWTVPGLTSTTRPTRFTVSLTWHQYELTHMHPYLLATVRKIKVPDLFFLQFCEFVSVSWLAHLAGSVVRILLDYVSHISICFNLQRILERTPQWEEISTILSKSEHMTPIWFDILNRWSEINFTFIQGEPRSLQHLCRLVVRSRMDTRILNDQEAMAAVPFPPRLISYLTYREDHLYRGL